eukprot:10749211-Alexandrium_andersonii.AAC.1
MCRSLLTGGGVLCLSGGGRPGGSSSLSVVGAAILPPCPAVARPTRCLVAVREGLYGAASIFDLLWL